MIWMIADQAAFPTCSLTCSFAASVSCSVLSFSLRPASKHISWAPISANWDRWQARASRRAERWEGNVSFCSRPRHTRPLWAENRISDGDLLGEAA